MMVVIFVDKVENSMVRKRCGVIDEVVTKWRYECLDILRECVQDDWRNRCIHKSIVNKQASRG